MKKGKVVGVFKDFHFQSLLMEMRPLYLVLYPERARVLFVKLQVNPEKPYHMGWIPVRGSGQR